MDAIIEKKVSSAPTRFNDGLTAHMDLLDARMTGRIKPISSGFADLDRRLDGGVERGTLTVVAGRPAMGKTAFGLAIAKNAAVAGGAGFLSMEMPKAQINDRLLASIGKLPLAWLKRPIAEDQDNWTRLTYAAHAAQELNLYLDDETALNMLEIRTKARQIKRNTKTLDVLVIDQLSFITGSEAENKAYELGEYTRGCKAIAKELDCAVFLLAQLNRECEKRHNKRPMASDLSSSGSIEQDADNIIFLYRDEVYNPETLDKGVCEVITAKQRQGEPGTVPLVYIGTQTRFEDYSGHWVPASMRESRKAARGFE
jgi:replicative DNA helicase